MNKCYLGSLNKVKLKAVCEVLKEYEVIGVKSNSLVSNQPLSDKETITGALNRAKSLPKDGLRIGLEAGVQFHDNILFLVNWGVLIDQKDNIYYAGGTRIPLPEFIKERIFNEKKELSEIMDDYLRTKDIRSKQGAIGVFTNNFVKRKDIFTHIVKLLYGQYIRKETI